MAGEEAAGKGRFWRWNDSRNKETAGRLARMYRDTQPKKAVVAPVDAPLRRANQPCFYDNRGNPNLVVDSGADAGGTAPSAHRELPEFKVRMTVESAEGEKFHRIEYRHANGHRVTRWLWNTEAQYAALRRWVRKKQARQRRDRTVPPRPTAKTTHREFERKPILSTQLEPGVTVRCNSYRQFEREVARRGKQIGDIR